MNVELITKTDLQALKTDIINEVVKLLQGTSEKKEWLKSFEVRKLLNCSPGTIQNLRINGTLEYSKIGGTIYYSYNSVMRIFEKNKRNAA